MLASLANALEVRFNLALELQSIATRASREGVLDDIAPQLELNIVSLAFKKFQWIPRRRVASTVSTVLTHLLLSTFIASSLDARLSSALSLIFIVVSTRARATLELGAAPLSLVASPRTWARACRRARSPTTHGSVTRLHAGRKEYCKGYSVLPRRLLLIAKPE
jgi:hypothetical protein